MRKSRLEAATDAILREFCRKHQIDLTWQGQFEFHPERKWAADFIVYHAKDYAWECPGNGVLIEIDGLFRFGRYTKHQDPAGYANDCEKSNAAQLLGWRMLRYTERMLASGLMEKDLIDFFGITS